MYPANMHPDERDEYREAICASKASEWNRAQAEGFMRGKRKISKSLYRQKNRPNKCIFAYLCLFYSSTKYFHEFQSIFFLDN